MAPFSRSSVLHQDAEASKYVSADNDLHFPHGARGAYNRLMKKFLLVFLVLALLGFTAKKMMDNA